ncbi:DUF4097 family beta strand repeat-containing protein [Streptomyces sp. NPDC048111]|uniref:DUF4097 family beta strand repeat-containing protein n=1 Tax=Streptomyces sp. NPDC048111 TaxID=3365500 RepID=UPI00371B871A
MRTFVTTGPITAVLDIPAGRVQIVATTDQENVTVDINPADAGRRRDVHAAEHATVDFGEGVLHIAVPVPVRSAVFGSSGSVDVTVHLPAGSRVQAASSAAELRTAGRLGDVVFDGAHGTVQLDEAASLRLTVHAGDVRVGRLTGDGAITVSAGDIRIDEAEHGTLTLHTHFGRISVGAAHGTSATLDAGTSHGRVHNTLSNTEGAAAALNIHATTSHGDITARSL